MGWGQKFNTGIRSRGLMTEPVTLTDAATVLTDASKGNTFRCALGGDRTIGAPTNPTDGQVIKYQLTASGAARTPTFATGAGGFLFGSDFTGVTQIASGKTDVIQAEYVLSADRWWIEGYVKGF